MERTAARSGSDSHFEAVHSASVRSDRLSASSLHLLHRAHERWRVGSADPSGQIEVRVPRERLGLIAVSAATVVLGGGTTSVIPVVSRGEGARVGSPHVLYLPVTGPTSLTIAETTGADHASVRVVT